MNRNYLKMICVILVIIVSFFFGQTHDNAYKEYEQGQQLKQRLIETIENGWRFSEEGKPYLMARVMVEECSLEVMKENLQIVVDFFNYKVQAKANNRRNGIHMKYLGAEKYEIPIRGDIDGRIIILKSINI